MWVSKRKWNAIEKRIAALEKEQLNFMKYVKNSITSNEELIAIVKELRDELGFN